MIGTSHHDTFLITLGVLLRNQNSPELTLSNGGTIATKALGQNARFWHWNDPKYHEMRLSNVASLVAKILAVQQRLSIAEAGEDIRLRACRDLIKNVKDYKCSTKQMAALKKEVNAAKLGIRSYIFDKNPGFEKFAELHHLERYFLLYNHNLKIDPKTHEVLLLKDGVFQPWSKLQTEIKQWKPFTSKPVQEWIYGPNGIQHLNMYDWTELLPYKKDDPAKWGHQYVLRVNSCYNPETPFRGNHSWVNFLTPEGDIYSVGLNTDEKINSIHSKALRVKPGYLMSPDVSEFWNFEIGSIDIAITKDQFQTMKAAIEEDKKRNDLVFQLTNQNCVMYCNKIASIAGVQLPTKDDGIKFLTPRKIQDDVEKMPIGIRKVCNFAATVLLNTFQLYLGAGAVDKKLNPQQKAVAVPHFKATNDIFDRSKVNLHHPNTFAFATRKKVMDWRAKEIRALDDLQLDLIAKIEKIKEINFSLPPHFREAKEA